MVAELDIALNNPKAPIKTPIAVAQQAFKRLDQLVKVGVTLTSRELSNWTAVLRQLKELGIEGAEEALVKLDKLIPNEPLPSVEDEPEF